MIRLRSKIVSILCGHLKSTQETKNKQVMFISVGWGWKLGEQGRRRLCFPSQTEVYEKCTGNEGDGFHDCWEYWLQRVPSYQPSSGHASASPEFPPPTEAAYIKWLVRGSEKMSWLLQSHAGQFLRTNPVSGLPTEPSDH